MTLSIRARLLLWMIGGMAVLLTIFAVAVYELISRSLVDGFDGVLLSSARTISGFVERDRERIKIEIDEHEAPEFYRTTRPDYFQMWLEGGETLVRSPLLEGRDLERFAGSPESPTFRPVRLPDGRAGRAVGLLIVPKIDEEVKEALPPQTVTLVVVRETASLDSTTALFRWFLAAAAGGTVILALLVGAFVIRQGLKPLDALAGRIAAIRHEDLSAQIPVGRTPAEVAPVIVKLNDLLRRLEETFRRERAFTADAAHELRTPLAGMRCTLEVALARPRSGEDYRQDMTDCLDIVCRMQAMVDALLALARLEGGQTTLSPEVLHVGEVIETAWRPLAGQARMRGIAFESRIPAHLACTADRDAVRMTLSCLLGNAAEYTNDGGRIEVVARRADESVELMVANTGCSLSEEDSRHVFERFWRGDTSRTQTGYHCGLGLALVQRTVASLGGAVSAAVANGTFTVHLILPAIRRS